MNKFLKQIIPVCMGLLLCSGGLRTLYASEPLIGLSRNFSPAVLRGIKVSPEDPFRFNFIVDSGKSGLSGDSLKTESSKLIRYFLASLTVPENDLWVNLSPNEKDRIIPNEFGTTEMGRDLLSQDYLLKQLSASLMYPEKDLGKEFWNKVYKQAQEKFGTRDIPVNTFNKVWIIPDRAVIYQSPGTAFIGETHLKVMMEKDYRPKTKDQRPETQDPKSMIAGQSFKEFLLPKIEKEVNEGENFAPLRQVYHSLILAAWYKRSLKQSILSQVYVDKNKVAGVDVADKDIKQKIYEQYLKTFKEGVYNLIREEKDESTGEMLPRKYFSGGIFGAKIGEAIRFLPLQGNEAKASAAVTGPLTQVEVDAEGVKTNVTPSLPSTPKAGLEWVSLPLAKRIETEFNKGSALKYIDFEVDSGDNSARFAEILKSFADDEYVAVMVHGQVNDDYEIFNMVIDRKDVLLKPASLFDLLNAQKPTAHFGQYLFTNSFWVFSKEKTVYSALIEVGRGKKNPLNGYGAFALKKIAQTFKHYYGGYYLLDLPLMPVIELWLETEFGDSGIDSYSSLGDELVEKTLGSIETNPPPKAVLYTIRKIPETASAITLVANDLSQRSSSGIKAESFSFNSQESADASIMTASSSSVLMSKEARKALFKLKEDLSVREAKRFAITGRFLLEITDPDFQELIHEIMLGSDGLLARVLLLKIPAKKEMETLNLLKTAGAIDPDTEHFRSFTLIMDQVRKDKPLYYLFIHEDDFRNPAKLMADVTREYIGNIVMHELFGLLPTHYENEIRSYGNLVSYLGKVLNDTPVLQEWVEREFYQFGSDELSFLTQALSDGIGMTKEYDAATQEYNKLDEFYLEAQAMYGNSSASSSVKGNENVGGIDLNPNQLQMDIRGQSSPISLPPNFEQIENLNIQGLVPVIINISPLNSLPTSWGITQKPPSAADKISLN